MKSVTVLAEVTYGDKKVAIGRTFDVKTFNEFLSFPARRLLWNMNDLMPTTERLGKQSDGQNGLIEER